MADEKLRRVAVFFQETDRKTKQVKTKVIELITNNLDWPTSVIAELYKRRWYIETFFKLLKKNLQVKNLLDTTKDACKSQIYIALICYFLLELVRRTMTRISHRFGHFVTLVRVCLTKYDLLEYVVNDIRTVSRKVSDHRKAMPEDHGQLALKMSSSKNSPALFLPKIR